MATRYPYALCGVKNMTAHPVSNSYCYKQDHYTDTEMKSGSTQYIFSIDYSGMCPINRMLVDADSQYIYRLRFLTEKDIVSANDEPPNALHLKAREQITAYFARELREFSLPLQLNGTPFQQQVWREIADIPYGAAVTYGKIAEKVGGVGMSRAVGQAANSNPIPLIVPCHRVIGTGGKLTGFASGVVLKKFLLGHEQGNMLW